jgi:lipoteichoic acid synthase
MLVDATVSAFLYWSHMHPENAIAEIVRPNQIRFFIYNIVCTSVLAWSFLTLFRVFIVGPDTPLNEIPAALIRIAGASYSDFQFILALAAIFVLIVWVVRHMRKLAWLSWLLFLLAVGLTVAWGFANVRVNRLLGEPFTYQWLLYADFLKNTAAQAAMADATNRRDVSLLSASVVAVLAGGGLTGWTTSILLARISVRRQFTGALVLIALCASVLYSRMLSVQVPYAKAQNAVMYFVSSLVWDKHPVLFTMSTAVGNQDFRIAGERPPERSILPGPNSSPIRNVLVFVLESTPWEYVEPFGGKFPVTPNLKKQANSAMLFTNLYAHAPATNYSLFSLLTSLYPSISYHSMTTSYPTQPFKTIASELSQYGFRTSFYWAADSRFQTFDKFIRGKGFDVVKDYRDIACERGPAIRSTKEWQNADAGYDPCVARAIGNWIAEQPDKPFFGVMMTAMTHYPYETDKTIIKYVDDEKLNKYLNALKIGDRAFGIIMDKLVETGKLDSTLVVVLGDHGEAFGQHGTFAHASALYEENVHVPLMLINGKRFNGTSSSTLGGIVDVAPTILDILHLSTPPEWQGRSLFTDAPAKRTFFFSPWNGYQFGYRQDNSKFIYNATTNKLEEYNLVDDPREKRNLIDGSKVSNEFLEPLAAWAQYQTKLMKQMIATAAASRKGCTLNEISFDAAGTNFRGVPKLIVRVDDQVVGETEIRAGVDSSAKSQVDILTEMKKVRSLAQSYKLPVSGVFGAQEIDISYENDDWSDDASGGDRNVFITNVTLNGHHLPLRYDALAEPAAGLVDHEGATLFKNSSIQLHAPFFPGC